MASRRKKQWSNLTSGFMSIPFAIESGTGPPRSMPPQWQRWLALTWRAVVAKMYISNAVYVVTHCGNFFLQKRLLAMVSPVCRKRWRWLERRHCAGGFIDIKNEFIGENNFSFVSYSVAPDMSLTLANDSASGKRTFKDFIVRFWTQDEGINYVWPISCLSFIFSYFLINSECVSIFMPMGYTFFQIKKECCVVKYTVYFSRNAAGLHSWFRVSFNTRDDDRCNI